MRKKPGGCCLGQILSCILLLAALFWLWNHKEDLIEAFFPTEHLEIVEEECRQYDLDPWLVMAMIREESSFDSTAVSHAGAHGLMQLLPATAAWAISKNGMEISTEAALNEAEANIQVGVWYISWLRDRYDGDLYAAVAAYNAGQTVVDEWLSEKIWDGTLENAAQIPYEETAKYLRSVWRSYEIYNILKDSAESTCK